MAFNILIYIDLPHSDVESISFNKEACSSADTSPRLLSGRVLEGTWGDMWWRTPSDRNILVHIGYTRGCECSFAKKYLITTYHSALPDFFCPFWMLTPYLHHSGTLLLTITPGAYKLLWFKKKLFTVKTFLQTSFCFRNHIGEQFNKKKSGNSAQTKGVGQLRQVTP